MPPKRRFASRSSNLVPERPSKKLRLSSPPMSPASSKISPKNLKLKRSRVSPSPSVKSEQSQTERIEDTIICAPIEWVPIIEDEDEVDVEEEEQLTQRSISFDEVFQNESVKRIITQFPKGHGSWYILRCEEHDVDFKTHPLRAASAHLRSRQHGRLQDTTGPAVIEHFGTKVLNCNDKLARKNNAAALKFKPAIKQEETQHMDEFIPAQFAPRESVSKEPTPEAVPEESVPEQPLPEEPASEAVPEAVPETISEAVPEVSVEESSEEPTRLEPTQKESTQKEPAQKESAPEETTPSHKKRKLSSTPCDVEDEVSPTKDEPMEESSHDPIISPTPGIVYLAYRESTKTWLPALVLPRNNLHKVGLSTTLESLGLVENVPKCYVYDPGTKCLEWKAQYEDGGSLVAQRQFPVVYFDVTGFPSKDAAGWVGTGDLQELDLSDASASLEPHFSLAKDFVAKRLGTTGDCKNLSPLAIPDTGSEMQSSTQATQTKIESPVLMISDNLPAKAPVVVSVIPEEEATPPVETPTTEPSREVSVESDSKPSVTTESFSELADPKPIGSPELVHKPELISTSEPINNDEPVASTDPIDDSRPTDSEPVEISEQISEPEPARNSEPIGSSELISKSEPVNDIETTNSPKPISNPEPISIPEHVASPVFTNEPEPIGNSEPINSFEPISRPEVVSRPEPINRPESSSAFMPVNSPGPANILHQEVSIENQPSRPSEPRSFYTEDVPMENQYNYSPASTYVDPVPTPPAFEIQSHQHSVKRALLNHMSADLFQLKAKSTTLIFPKAVFDLETLQPTLPPIQSLPSMQGYSQTLRPISDQMGSPVPSISQTQSFPSQSTPSSAYNSPAPQHTPVPQHTPAPQYIPAPQHMPAPTTVKKKTGPRKPVPTHRPVPSQRPVPTVPTQRASATPKPAIAQRAAIAKKPAAPRRPVPTQRPLASYRPAAVEEAEPRFGETLYGVSEYILQGVRRWLRTTEKNPKISEFCFSDGLYRCPWCHKRFARAGIFTDHLSLKHDERPKPPEIRPDHR